MNLSPEERALLSGANTVKIETRSPRGDLHRTVIRIVVDGEDAVVRSVRGPVARWYREATSGRPVTIAVGRAGRPIPVQVRPSADTASVERCNTALRVKYAADPALSTMLQPHTLSTTLRVLAGA